MRGVLSERSHVEASHDSAGADGPVAPADPGERRPSRMSKWDVIYYVSGDTRRTIRVFFLILSSGIAATMPLAFLALVRGWLC